MSIPTFQEIMRPWLELASDGHEHTLQEVISSLADKMMLSPEERAEMLPIGFQGTFTNRVAWAATHLQKAQALDRVGRGRYRITDRGNALLAAQGPITTARLMQFLKYQEFKARGKEAAPTTADLEDTTPAEAIDSAFLAVRGAVAAELLDRIKASPPDFFERLVVDLLLKMGYGGSRRDAGQAVGKSGDGGIDGVIKEDRLGLDAGSTRCTSRRSAGKARSVHPSYESLLEPWTSTRPTRAFSLRLQPSRQMPRCSPSRSASGSFSLMASCWPS